MQKSWVIFLLAATLAAAQSTRFDMANSAGEIAFASCVVTEFRLRSDLDSWGNSGDLISAALSKWLRTPPHKNWRLDNPIQPEVKALLTETIPAELGANDVLVFYLGTHHLKSGRLLLADGDAMLPSELATWLGKLSNTVILIGDVCYAAALEEEAKMPDNVVRIYASGDKEKTPEVRLDGRYRAVSEFFKELSETIPELGVEHDRFSLTGCTFVDSLRAESADPDAEVRIDRLLAQMRRRHVELRIVSKLTRLPTPVGFNLQPVVLRAAARPVAPVIDPAQSNATFAEIAALLERPEPRLDLARAAVLVAKLYRPKIDADAYLARVNAVSHQARLAIGSERKGAKIVPILNELIFEKIGITPEQVAYNEDFLIDRLLDEKRGRCSGLVSLYLAIAEDLGLPLVAVCVPEHVFVRWDPWAPAEEQFREKRGWFSKPRQINIETTYAGKELPDADYRRMLRGKASLRGANFYMRALTKREAIGLLLSPLGSALREQGRLEEAMQACQLAVKVNENDAEAWNNLGMVYRRQKELKAARMAYARAIEIFPAFAEAHNNLGSITSDAAERVALFRKAIEIKPDLAESWKNLAIAYVEQGDDKLAWICIQKCQELNHAVPPALVSQVQERLR
jgi:regulator of sirC expression with transglutaminase-like and TPR domain